MNRLLKSLTLAFLIAAFVPCLVGADEDHPKPLAIGSSAPDFHLTGIDGKTYSLADFKDAKILVVIFTAVHCPTAEVYEGRIKKLVADYRDRGVAFVVIQPNSPKGLRLDEMAYTDVGDTLDDMKIRAKYRDFNFPFLYDGETQEVAHKYGRSPRPTFSFLMRNESCVMRDASIATRARPMPRFRTLATPSTRF